MMTRRQLLGMLFSLPLTTNATVNRMFDGELEPIAKPIPLTHRPRHLQAGYGFCALQSMSAALERWKTNPLAPRRSYQLSACCEDDSKDDLPVDTATVRRWKEILLWLAPTQYRRLFPEDDWITPFRIEP
jgi:hypothetical protein